MECMVPRPQRRCGEWSRAGGSASPGGGLQPRGRIAGRRNSEDGKVSLFILNRDLNKAHVVEINSQGKAPSQVLNSTTLTASDLKAFNSFDAPKRVAPQAVDKPSTAGARTKLEVPARSYSVIQWAG